jgi:eukaryotic-like serine/threonine-protein kinase
MRPGLLIGGRYELLELVGEGGMSLVWKGVSRSTDLFTRRVAIKVMKSFQAVQPHLDMFLEEARIGADLQHPHLIQVFDFVAHGTGARTDYCLIMEWIEGMDLRTLIKCMNRLDRPLPWALVAHVGVGVLRGLAAAHERKLADGSHAPVIHRDVAPQNILLGLNGCIKLADFGLARARDRASRLTAPGMVKGTLSYMAPEILRGKPACLASDQFSVGCALWEALAGERLFDGATDADVVVAIRSGHIRPLADRRPDVPPSLIAAIERSLSSDPDHRFMSARTMVQEIGDVLRHEGPFVDADLVVATTIAQARDAPKLG